MGLAFKQFTEELKPYARMHQVVIIVIIALWTLCYSIMSHAPQILYLLCIHVSTTNLLTIVCTLVATNMKLGR